MLMKHWWLWRILTAKDNEGNLPKPLWILLSIPLFSKMWEAIFSWKLKVLNWCGLHSIPDAEHSTVTMDFYGVNYWYVLRHSHTDWGYTGELGAIGAVDLKPVLPTPMCPVFLTFWCPLQVFSCTICKGEKWFPLNLISICYTWPYPKQEYLWKEERV